MSESELGELHRPQAEGQAPEDAFLVLIYGADPGRRHRLVGEVSIGSSETNGVVVDLPRVSRRHALVVQRGEDWLVADLESAAGTYLNGTKVEGEVLLADGDLLRVGSAIFKLIAGSNVEVRFYEEIYRLAIFDGLTGIHNKRYLLETLDREISRARRHHRLLSLAMLDIDHFEQINDTRGFMAGDHVLESMARLIQEHVRLEQLFARCGGEEFVLVLPETDLEQARFFCNRMRQLVEETTFQFDGEQFHISVSIGIAALEGGVGKERFLQAADKELQRAKRLGRNRVIAQGDP